MQFFKCIGNHNKEPTYSYFDDINQPIHIKLGNISAVYSNKNWQIDKDIDNEDINNNAKDSYDEDSSNERNINTRDEDLNNENKNKSYNKKLKKRNKELENENRQLKWKIEMLLSKLAEAKFEIQQLREID